MLFKIYDYMPSQATNLSSLVWTFILLNTTESGTKSYSYALLGMAVLMFIGLIIVRQIKVQTKAEGL